MKSTGRASVAFVAGLLGVLVGAGVVFTVGRSGLSRPAGGVRIAPAGSVSVPVSQESQDAITAAVAKVGPAVVNINTVFQPAPTDSREQLLRQFGFPTEPFPRQGQGSGIIIDSEQGYILTNAHVAARAAKMEVALADGRRFEAKPVGFDRLSDIAVVQISGKGLPAATLGTSDQVPIGSWVIAIGNPFGFENSVTVGVLSATDRYIRDPETGRLLSDLLQTDASINPGNSGGALVDVSGNVVGIPTAIIPFAQGMGFAVSVDVAKQVAERLISTGKMPYLGVTNSDLQPEDAKRLRVPEGKGSLVVSVDPNGAAVKAGIRPGDVILRLGDYPTEGAKALGKAVRSYDAGTRIDVIVWRDGREVKLEAVLGEVPQ